MVKRPKTPEVIEEVRLYAVYLPYPLNATWADEDDQKACAFWVAEVIGSKEYLFNIYQMPSARGMILLEISKEFTNQGILLGEHQWRRILKSPEPDEVGRKTCVYHSTYSNTREAHKAGWRPIFVQERWFKDWRRGKGPFVYPYPETSYCQPPPEDKTNKPVCRPLPVEHKPPPPSVASPVVGSPAWTTKQQEEKLNKEAMKGAWKKQNLSVKVGTQSTNHAPPQSANSGRPRGAAPATAAPEPSPRTPNLTPLGSASAGQKPAWGKPVPLGRFTSNGPPSASKSPAPWASQIQKSASASNGKSPFTEEPPVGPQNAWKKPLKIVPEKPPIIVSAGMIDDSEWGKPSTESWFDLAEDCSSYGGGQSDGDVEAVPESSSEPTPPVAPELVVNSSKGNKKRRARGKGAGTSEPKPIQVTLQPTLDPAAYETLEGDEGGETFEGILAPWEQGSTTGDDETSPITPADDDPTTSATTKEDWESAWAMEEDPQKKAAPEILCPVHKLSCARKICIDYTNEQRRLKKLKEREAWQANGGATNGRRGRGRGGANGNWRNHEGNTQTEEGEDGFVTATKPRSRKLF
ncbi:hypothetical protein CPB83DRAFT_850784 [Crepidotus variabilis]|uniref:Uncharacterized protein n=1 Tax=Crepidotus variabilis TaxID=179855 RepID=A0A9P6EIM2_9AGAR|nr:hypothetical protein CPB83DRAFT_850784 [Crepidotus variabilis]